MTLNYYFNSMKKNFKTIRRYVGTGRQDGLKIRCEKSRESSSLSGATKK